jgi:Leucine rich repeat/Leucine rich repeat N-terminal domain/Leucine Rich Repeat
MPSLPLFFLFLSFFTFVSCEPVEDKFALLDFLAQAPHSRDLNWDQATPVCNAWTGVTCSADESRIVAVRLPALGLNGQIPPNTLSRLTSLQILSLRANGFTGPFPPDFANLTSLTGLHLQLNSFSGSLPLDFSAWKNLTVLDLSFNNFTGSIPASISNLTQLVALNLSNNSLSSEIPDIQLPNLQYLNLSNNELNGTVPESLRRFPKSDFTGNNLSSDSLLPPAPSPSVTSSIGPITPARKHKFSEAAILGIVIGGTAVLFAIAALLFVLTWGRKDNTALEKVN